MLEVANDVFSSEDRGGGVVQSICPSPLYAALAFDPLCRFCDFIFLLPCLPHNGCYGNQFSTVLFPGIYLIQKLMGVNPLTGEAVISRLGGVLVFKNSL